MHYIVLDLEFNQDFSDLKYSDSEGKKPKYPFEIIQIGAVKLDSSFNTVGTFNRYIKPTIYTKVSPFITELTGITTEQVISEKAFPEVYKEFIDFIKDSEAIFCIWGMSDIQEIFRNASYHELDSNLLPRKYINIQPYVSKHFGLSIQQLFNLQNAVEELSLPITFEFHNALYDAHYTAEVLKKVYTSAIQPQIYDPTYVKPRPRKPKIKIDYCGLIKQFEKMYDREMTKEEKDIIKLAYNMGRTKQFITITGEGSQVTEHRSSSR
jgi:inhibitor of KinA sporulation pathway (predicted exonuclease)